MHIPLLHTGEYLCMGSQKSRCHQCMSAKESNKIIVEQFNNQEFCLKASNQVGLQRPTISAIKMNKIFFLISDIEIRNIILHVLPGISVVITLIFKPNGFTVII